MRLILTFLISCAILIGSALCRAPAEAQLRGHGGPIRALAISADGASALSGSFDTSAIRWSLRRNTAEQVLRFHEGAVNAVAILTDGRAVTAGEDARIALWTPGKQEPDAILEGHQGPIAARGRERSIERYWAAALRWRATGTRRPSAERQRGCLHTGW